MVLFAALFCANTAFRKLNVRTENPTGLCINVVHRAIRVHTGCTSRVRPHSERPAEDLLEIGLSSFRAGVCDHFCRLAQALHMGQTTATSV